MLTKASEAFGSLNIFLFTEGQPGLDNFFFTLIRLNHFNLFDDLT